MEIEWKDEILYKDLVKWGDRLKKEAPFFKKILEDMSKENARILDVSCGTGFHLVMLSKWGFSGIGVDISEQNVDEAVKLAKESSVQERAKFILGDILEIEKAVEGERFDFVYCIGNTLSIFSAEERNIIIQQLINALNPGGKILLQVVNYLSHSNDDVWYYNPNLKRSSNGSLNFHIRMMEWKERNQKVTMYVHNILQASKDSEDFKLGKKKTEFFVLRKDDFKKYQINEKLEVTFLGDYYWNEFDEEKSNDLVVIIDKIV
ncbi:MAG: class I SAM-dependent methyltransferase [Candidatus Heimdallarchaeota archaeon]|nr:class I SAM-dependent methyltransferase [Candidatus Heimdallarchaeota archaeon]